MRLQSSVKIGLAITALAVLVVAGTYGWRAVAHGRGPHGGAHVARTTSQAAGARVALASQPEAATSAPLPPSKSATGGAARLRVSLPPLTVRPMRIVAQVEGETPLITGVRRDLVEEWDTYRRKYALTPNQELAVLSVVADVQEEIARVLALRDDATRAERASIMAGDLAGAEEAAEEWRAFEEG